MEKETKGKCLSERLESDIKEAMRARDSVRVSTLRMLKAAVKNTAIEKRAELLEDADILRIISKQIKQHEDSIEQFTKGERVDLAEKEKAELEILKGYIPPAMSNEELISITKKAVKELGAVGKKDMGRVMKAVMEKVAGRADGRAVSQVVSSQLDSITY